MARLTKDEQLVLVTAARQGNNDAIAALYNDVTPLIRRGLYQMVGPDDIDDVVQSTMKKAFERLDQYQEEARFSTWCFSIAKNDALMLRRKDKRRQEIIVDSIDRVVTGMGRARQAIDVGYEDRKADQNLAAATVERGMAMLSERDRVALKLTLDGENHEYIGQVLGLSESNTKSVIRRARLALRDVLTGERSAGGVKVRYCACECGTQIGSSGQPYAKGHKRQAEVAVV